MTLRQALGQATEALLSHDIEDASLEAEVLLRHCLSLTPAQLYSEPQRELTAEQEGCFWDSVERRLAREPLAYIIGRREFYGLDFYVDRRVFIPRPESELLVEQCLELARHLPGRRRLIADVGTGCGAIAVSLALNLPQAELYAIDISVTALEVARLNCQRHGVAPQLHLLRGDMLQPLTVPVDIIVANLPYISESDFSWLSAEVSNFEPTLALAGGGDGLDGVRRLLSQAGGKLRNGGSLLLEVGWGQGAGAMALAHNHFPSAMVELLRDLGGVNRVVRVTP